MAKFCHACGASLPDGAKFCHSCGQVLPQGSPTEQLEPVIQELVATVEPIQPHASSAPSSIKKPFFKNWWVWLIAVLVVGGIIYALLNSGGLSQSPQKLIVGDWICYEYQKTTTISFYKDGTYLESYGSDWQITGTYKINNKGLLTLSYDDTKDVYQWDQARAINDTNNEYWHVAKDYLIYEGEKYTKSANSPSRNKTSAPRKLQPVSQQEVEAALRHCTSVTIVSHDIDSLIDSVTYKAFKNYEYMDLETTGIIAFEYDPDTNEWERYTAGDSILSQEENWEKLIGQYEYRYNLPGVWGRPELDIFFKIIIDSVGDAHSDGSRFVEGYYYYRRSEYSEYIDEAEDVFSIEPEPSSYFTEQYDYYVDLYDGKERTASHWPKFIIDRDKGILVVTSITPASVTKIG